MPPVYSRCAFRMMLKYAHMCIVSLPFEAMTAIYVTKQLAHWRNEYFTW